MAKKKRKSKASKGKKPLGKKHLREQYNDLQQLYNDLQQRSKQALTKVAQSHV